MIAEGWSIECKQLGCPGFADLVEAVSQAEFAAKPDENSVAVVKRKQRDGARALVVLRLEGFGAWFIGKREAEVRDG